MTLRPCQSTPDLRGCPLGPPSPCRPVPVPRLTPREREIVRYAYRGMGRPAMNENTWKHHVRNILRKTGARRLGQLAIWMNRRDPGFGVALARVIERDEALDRFVAGEAS